MERIINPGSRRIGRWDAAVYCKITYQDGRLRITGVEGPKKNGNCLGSSGQIEMNWEPLENLAIGWSRATEAQFIATWRRWHLNDMRAECEHQRAMGWTWGTHPSEPCPTCGYKLGHAWLTETVPDEVIAFLESLPESHTAPAWV